MSYTYNNKETNLYTKSNIIHNSVCSCVKTQTEDQFNKNELIIDTEVFHFDDCNFNDDNFDCPCCGLKFTINNIDV